MGRTIVAFDSSVLITILLAEPKADDYAKRLIDIDDLYFSAVSIVESAMVIEYKKVGREQSNMMSF
jgi:uncharacterized protein with PIN domain